MTHKALQLLLLTFFLTNCTGLFYFPSKQQILVPSELGLEYRDIWIEEAGKPKLHAWFLPAKDPIATVLHLHGNAENISTHLASVYWMPARGIQVLTVDYRGYGLSEGETSISGIQEDVERASNFVQTFPAAGKKPLLLFGQSLGGSMALYTSSKLHERKIFDAVVAESPFASYRQITQEKLAGFWISYLFQYPLKFLMDESYAPIDQVGQLADQRVLLIHGTADETVPFHNSEELCRTIGPSCELWTIEGGGHIQAFKYEEVREKFVNFVKSLPSNLALDD